MFPSVVDRSDLTKTTLDLDFYSGGNMDWQGGIRLAISALFAVSHGLKISLLTVLRAVFYVLHLATYPISWLWAVLVFILTPVIHTIRYVFIQPLEPFNPTHIHHKTVPKH